MKYSFTCYGHKNITARHKTTLEFTKEEEVSLKGDCIVGVKADFDLLQLKRFIKKLNARKSEIAGTNFVGNNKKITIIIKPILNSRNKINKDYNNKIIEKIKAEINLGFNSDKDMVIRKTGFISERTLAIKADKAAFELDRGLVEHLKSGGKAKIEITTYQ